MKQKMVVTNLRMPESDWLQVKASAGEMGMSVNEYLNYVTNRYSVFHTTPVRRSKAKKLSIWDLPSVAKQLMA